MLPNAQTFVAVHGGQAFALRLRTCDDGYISGYERAAVELLLEPFAARPTITLSDILADEPRVSRILNLILVEGARGGFERRDAYGETTLEPLPWSFWYDLDEQLIEEILHRFFLSAERKTKRLRDSGNSTALRLASSLTFACAMSMNSTAFTSSPVEAT